MELEHALAGTWPEMPPVPLDIPPVPRRYPQQALDSLHAPDGAAMLAAFAVDAMLKARGLDDGTLNARTGRAAAEHLITHEMPACTLEVRLGANDPRHTDGDRPHREPEDAKRLVDVATALAEFLFVLPARVSKGRNIARARQTAPQTPRE